MTGNSVHNKLERFAIPSVSFREFMSMLKQTNAGNTMFIKWRTAVPPTHRASYELFWGEYYSNSDQSVTKEEEGMVNLQAPTTIEGWRTLTYDNISSFRYQGKTYQID